MSDFNWFFATTLTLTLCAAAAVMPMLLHWTGG